MYTFSILVAFFSLARACTSKNKQKLSLITCFVIGLYMCFVSAKLKRLNLDTNDDQSVIIYEVHTGAPIPNTSQLRHKQQRDASLRLHSRVSTHGKNVGGQQNAL